MTNTDHDPKLVDVGSSYEAKPTFATWLRARKLVTQ